MSVNFKIAPYPWTGRRTARAELKKHSPWHDLITHLSKRSPNFLETSYKCPLFIRRGMSAKIMSSVSWDRLQQPNTIATIAYIHTAFSWSFLSEITELIKYHKKHSVEFWLENFRLIMKSAKTTRQCLCRCWCGRGGRSLYYSGDHTDRHCASQSAQIGPAGYELSLCAWTVRSRAI